MTIDLTDGANAGWMSFGAKDRGTRDANDGDPDGVARVRVIELFRQKHQRALVEVDLDENGDPIKARTTDTTDAVDEGWLEEAHDWMWDQYIGDENIF